MNYTSLINIVTGVSKRMMDLLQNTVCNMRL